MSYTLAYEVHASGKYEAIVKATGMLRKDVRLIAVASTEEVAPGFWKVSMKVAEDA